MESNPESKYVDIALFKSKSCTVKNSIILSSFSESVELPVIDLNSSTFLCGLKTKNPYL